MNKAKCLKCGDIIESKHRHDYITCKCGNLSVDGGNAYHKRSWKEDGTWEDMSFAPLVGEEEAKTIVFPPPKAEWGDVCLFGLGRPINEDNPEFDAEE